MPLDDGEKAIMINIIREEVSDCPTGKSHKDELNRIDKRVDQMQFEIKSSMTSLSNKVDENSKEGNNRWFTVLMAILGQFLALLIGILFIALKVRGG